MARYKYEETAADFEIGILIDGKVETYEVFEIRLDPHSIPEGKYYYEVAGDDDCGDIACRIKKNILVNYLYSIVGPKIENLENGSHDVLWIINEEHMLHTGETVWLTEFDEKEISNGKICLE